MRILYANELMDYVVHGLLRGLARQGHQVRIVPLRLYPPDAQWAVLFNEGATFQPDLILTPGWSIDLFDLHEYRRAIADLNIFHAYWATEDPVFFKKCSMEFAPFSDYVFTTTEEFVPRYHEMAKPSSTLLFGCNPEIHCKVPPQAEYAHDIVLIANNYFWFPREIECRRRAIRTMLLPLVQADLDVGVYGVGWTKPEADISIPKQFHAGYCHYLNTATAYSSAKIVLGLHSDDTSLTQTSVRTFEIMGSGAFYLTYYTPAHEHLFQNHKHLVWSKSPEETVELARYYLQHDAERERIAAAGQALVYAKHTYDHRAEEFCEALAPFMGVGRRRVSAGVSSRRRVQT